MVVCFASRSDVTDAEVPHGTSVHYVSAHTGEGIPQLLTEIESRLLSVRARVGNCCMALPICVLDVLVTEFVLVFARRKAREKVRSYCVTERK